MHTNSIIFLVLISQTFAQIFGENSDDITHNSWISIFSALVIMIVLLLIIISIICTIVIAIREMLKCAKKNQYLEIE